MCESRPPRHSYQNRALEFIKQEGTAYLAAEMGMGKTRVIVDLLADLGLSALVVSPIRVMYSTWPGEIQKWQPQLTYQIVHGPNKPILAKRAERAQITLLNYEGLKWFYQQMSDGVIHKRKFDVVVFDESTAVKSHKSQRFKILQAMDKLFGPYRICLSATPMPNGYQDLWSQMWLLDHGKALGPKWSHFLKQFYMPVRPPFYQMTILPDAPAKIQQAIGHKFLRLKASDYLEMPELIRTQVEVPLIPTVYKKYLELKKNAVVEWEDLETKIKHRINATQASAVSAKLRQLVQGALYLDEGGYKVCHTERIKALKALMEENEGSSILTAIQFRFEVEMLRKAFGTFPIISGGTPANVAAQYIDRWNSGQIPLMACHPASISHGVNLQSGGHIMLWMGIPWSLEHYTQLNGRLHRQGQKHAVTINHLVSPKTIDVKVLEALSIKDQNQEGFLNAIRSALF